MIIYFLFRLLVLLFDPTYFHLVFCCISALKILESNTNKKENEWLGAWLALRQCSNGGLNGRPEKLEDVCYSWWVLSSLAALNKISWIDKDSLIEFIINCQDCQGGGFADRPGDCSDIFHTLFALTGLSLLNSQLVEVEIDPTYCLPKVVLSKVFQN